MASRLTFEEAHRFLTEHGEAVLLDVREEPEYITGHARDALLLPVDELTEESAALAVGTKDTPVLVVLGSPFTAEPFTTTVAVQS